MTRPSATVAVTAATTKAEKQIQLVAVVAVAATTKAEKQIQLVVVVAVAATTKAEKQIQLAVAVAAAVAVAVAAVATKAEQLIQLRHSRYLKVISSVHKLLHGTMLCIGLTTSKGGSPTQRNFHS